MDKFNLQIIAMCLMVSGFVLVFVHPAFLALYILALIVGLAVPHSSEGKAE